jgi:hypothetical protein
VPKTKLHKFQIVSFLVCTDYTGRWIFLRIRTPLIFQPHVVCRQAIPLGLEYQNFLRIPSIGRESTAYTTLISFHKRLSFHKKLLEPKVLHPKMLKNCLALGLLGSIAASTVGVDLSQLTSVSSLQCVHNYGYDFVIARVYCSSGSPDSNGPANINNAWSAGMSHVDGYIFPCYSCGNPGKQVGLPRSRDICLYLCKIYASLSSDPCYMHVH